MDNNRSYLVSFGDSTRYRVYFPGSKEEFEASESFNKIKGKVSEFLSEKFPTGGYKAVVDLTVADDDGRDYPVLDESKMPELLESVERQVEVLRQGENLTNNAPYDNI